MVLGVRDGRAVQPVVDRCARSVGQLVGTILLAGFLATTLSNFVGLLRRAAHVPVRPRSRQLRDPARVVGLGSPRRRRAYPVARGLRADLSLELKPRTERAMDDRPRNLKAMLSEAKDTSELMVDLGYAALFFADDAHGRRSRASSRSASTSSSTRCAKSACSPGARSATPSRSPACCTSCPRSNAWATRPSTSVAIVTHRLGIPAALVADLAAAEEVSHRVRVRAGSAARGPARSKRSSLPMDVGMRIVALRRGRDWFIDPDGDDLMLADDVLIMRGAARRDRRDSASSRARPSGSRRRCSRKTRRSATSTAPSTCSSR